MNISLRTAEIILILIALTICVCLLIIISIRMKKTNTKIRTNEERFRVTLMHIGNVLFSNILEADITTDTLLGDNCAALTKLLGIPTNSSYSTTIDAISKKLTKPEYAEEYRHKLSIENLLSIYNNGGNSLEYECVERSDGVNYNWIRVHICIFKSEVTNTVRIISYVKNIEEEKRKLEELKKAAEIDLLTNTYNKISFRNAITEILQGSHIQKHTLAMMDIDNFKHINDTYGHSMGDVILSKVADKLKKVAGANDIVGRVGGDEFIIFFNDIAEIKAIENKMKKLYDEFSMLNSELEEGINIGISVGIVIVSTKQEFEEAYHHADIALYRAKHKGKNQFVIY